MTQHSREIQLDLLAEPDEAISSARAMRPPSLPAIQELEPLPRTRPRPVKAAPAFLSDGANAEEAFRLTLLQCKWHIAANIPAVIEARDIEGMHQMRVGFRRLRVAFTSFGHEFRTPSMRTLRLRAKQIADRLAPARDLDVFLTELFEAPANANGAVEAFEALRARAERQRRKAWNEAAVQIASPAFSGFMNDLGAAIDRRHWREGLHSDGTPAAGLVAFEAPARTLADRMLAGRLKTARRRARHLEKLSEAERHRLRISLKKLRYTCEFFAPLYDAKEVAAFLKRLSKMQDILGGLNDVFVARDTLDALVSAGDAGPLASAADLSFAAGILYGWHLERAADLWTRAVERWKKFGRKDPYWIAAG